MRMTTPLTKAGPSYNSDAVFDLSQMQPYTLFDLLVPIQSYTKNIVLYLPRTSDLRQLAVTTPKGFKLTVIHYCMEGASKVVRVQFCDVNQVLTPSRPSVHILAISNLLALT